MAESIWKHEDNYLINMSAQAIGYCLAVSCRSLGTARDQDGALSRGAKQFILELGYAESLLYTVSQVHGVSLVDIDLLSGPEPTTQADGMTAHNAQDFMGVFTADCLSVALIEPESGIRALVHSGWRGSQNGITEQALEEMVARGAKREQISLFFGPSIGSCCYQVGPEFRDYFPESFLEQRSDGLYFNNQGFVSLKLINSGLKPENIYKSDLCTVCSNHFFFSHRLEKEAAGRNLTVLGPINNESAGIE